MMGWLLILHDLLVVGVGGKTVAKLTYGAMPLFSNIMDVSVILLNMLWVSATWANRMVRTVGISQFRESGHTGKIHTFT